MALNIEVIQTGPLGNNVCVLFDDQTRQAWVIDPSYEIQPVIDFVLKRKLQVETILLTHGHFDHFAGVKDLVTQLPVKPRLALHRADLDLLLDGGGSKSLHMPVAAPGEPDLFLEDGQVLSLAGHTIEVRATPGHTPGSVILVISDLNLAFCGDLIFYHSIGRTDLAGGDQEALITSIQEKVFTLPLETKLIPGHGENTTVAEEMNRNPYLSYADW